MKTAIITDQRTGDSFSMDAESFEMQIAGNPRLKIPPGVPDWRARYIMVDADQAAPMHFHRTHWRNGNEARVSACFARAAGYGDQDHIFDHDHQTLPQAVAAGKKVLLSLNTDLSYRPVNYRSLHMPGVGTLEDYIAHNRRNYISVSVTGAGEAIETVKALNKLDGDLHKERLSVLYRGAVMPWGQFYLGGNDEKLCAVYDDLKTLRGGLKRGETRAIGFPRLMRFQPTKTTLDEKGTKGLKGNPIWRDEHQRRLLSQLIFSDEREKTSQEQIRIYRALSESPKGLYVMAAPTISRGVNARSSEWQHLRWIINDFDRQTSVPAPVIGPAGNS